jgi:hypothetical protein
LPGQRVVARQPRFDRILVRTRGIFVTFGQSDFATAVNAEIAARGSGSFDRRGSGSR